MATRVISWGSKMEIVSPRLSKTPFMISFDSLNYDNLGTRPAVEGAPCATGSQVKHTKSQGIVPSGSGPSSSVSVYHGAGAAEGSFIRHNKYFFNDGNVTFLVGNMLYCVHRYFFSRDSIYFSTRFAMLDIRDHEALPTIISLGDIECKDFDAFLSVLYPEDFEESRFSYEEWRSVLHLSTRWSFASIRKLVLRSINPPTSHDRLLLARTYSVEEWVVPALSALCGRTKPLTLSEARQMSIEDVVLVSTVREDIRNHTLEVDAAEIPLRVEAEQLSTLGPEVPFHLRFPKSKASASVRLKRDTKEDDPEKGGIDAAIESAQASGGAAQSAVSGASVEKPPSSGPISSGADNTPAHESTPQRDAAGPEARNTPETLLTTPTDSSVPPPIPAKGAAIFNMPIPASQQTSTSSLQTTDRVASESVDRDKAGKTVASSSEEDAAAAAKSDDTDPEAVAKGPTAQFGAYDSHATGEGSTVMWGVDAKSEKPSKLTLPMDRVCHLSAATLMSSSSVETPVDEAEWPAVEVGEEGEPGEPSTPRKPKRGKKLKKKRAEKNGPRPASGEAVNDVDYPIEQKTRPFIPDPVDVIGGECDGVLVEKADNSGEDSAVFVDAPWGRRYC